MYRNLEAEIARAGVTRKDLARVLGCSLGTVSMKMTGKSPFTIPDARAIKSFLGGDKPIEYLFEVEQGAS